MAGKLHSVVLFHLYFFCECLSSLLVVSACPPSVPSVRRVCPPSGLLVCAGIQYTKSNKPHTAITYANKRCAKPEIT